MKLLNFIMIQMCSICLCGSSRLLILPRIKRGNTFDPAWPAFPTQNQPLWQPIPYPIPTSTMSPADALLPKPPKVADNPFLDNLNEPINPNIGMGFVALQPTIIGGNMNFPVFNMLRPQESVSGTFGLARPVHVRYGMQGGPYFPWQDKQYTRTAKELSSAFRENQQFRDQADQRYVLPPLPSEQNNNKNLPPFRPFNPVLPPQMPAFSS